jgi:hypothetical protein
LAPRSGSKTSFRACSTCHSGLVPGSIALVSVSGICPSLPCCAFGKNERSGWDLGAIL